MSVSVPGSSFQHGDVVGQHLLQHRRQGGDPAADGGLGHAEQFGDLDLHAVAAQVPQHRDDTLEQTDYRRSPGFLVLFLQELVDGRHEIHELSSSQSRSMVHQRRSDSRSNDFVVKSFFRMVGPSPIQTRRTVAIFIASSE